MGDAKLTFEENKFSDLAFFFVADKLNCGDCDWWNEIKKTIFSEGVSH